MPQSLASPRGHSSVKRVLRVSTFVLALLAILPAAAQAQQIEQAVGVLSDQILESLHAQGKTNVAVVELTDLSGQVTPLGRLVSEELISQLFHRGGKELKLIERSKLDAVLGEQKLGVTGLLEKQHVEAFGRILGVQAILTGSIAVLQDRVRINIRLIGVPSAELFATAATYMSRLGLDESYFEPESPRESVGDATSRDKESRPAGPIASKSLHQISYELLGCTKATRLITCHLVLTNNGADRDYWLAVDGGSQTYIYDQRGYGFLSTRVRLADVEANGNVAHKFLITEIPTEATIFFEGVPSSIEFIKILHLSTNDGDLEFRDVHFKDD